MTEDAQRKSDARLEIVRVLPASPERVWQYWVDPDLRQTWFCAGETGNTPGEPFTMDFDHSRISDCEPPEHIGCGEPVVLRGTILEYEPSSKLVYRWPGQDGADTLVTVELHPVEGGTELRLTHDLLISPEFRQGASIGWQAHLDLLVDVTSGAKARDFWLHYTAIEAEAKTQVGS